MSAKLTITEFRNMQMDDLMRELKEQNILVAKLRLGIKMNKEKDSAKYRREKHQIALIQTVLTEKKKETVSVPSPKKS